MRFHLLFSIFIFCFAGYLAFFISFPFLSVTLVEHFHVSTFQAGLMVGALPFASVFSSIIFRALLDSAHPQRAVPFAVTVVILGYLYLAAASSTFGALTALVVIGFGKGWVDPLTRRLIAELTESLATSPSEKGRGFQVWYSGLCAGAALGPLLGIWLKENNHSLIFVGSACLALFELITFLTFLKHPVEKATQWRKQLDNSIDKGLDNASITWKKGIWIVGPGFLIFTCFSQFESLVPLTLKLNHSSGLRIFAYLLCLNAVLTIVLQPFTSWCLKHFHVVSVLAAGCVFFTLGFVGFSFAQSHLLVWLSAVILFSVGEAICFPSGELLISEIAPPHKKGLFFALAELRELGFAAGPAIGSWLLQTQGQLVCMGMTSAVVLGLAISLFMWKTSYQTFSTALPLPKHPSRQHL